MILLIKNANMQQIYLTPLGSEGERKKEIQCTVVTRLVKLGVFWWLALPKQENMTKG